MKYTLKQLLDDHQTGHSEFQDDYFITIRAGGSTAYGQYKQALRELYKRVRGMREILCDIEILEIDIEENFYLSKNGVDRFARERAEIEQKRKTMQKEEAIRVRDNTKRELLRFYSQCCQLKAKIGDLDPEKRARLDRNMWSEKVKSMMAVDFVTRGRLGPSTYEFISALPKSMRGEALFYFDQDNHQLLIDWFETLHDESRFDNDVLLEDGDAKALLEDFS
jgi:hypothetical protein